MPGVGVIRKSLSGQEVANGYAQATSNFAYSTDNNPADVTGVTITFTPLQAAVMIRAGGHSVTQTASGASPQLRITDGSANIVALVGETVITGALSFSIGTLQARLTLTPGTSVTYKLMVLRGGASGTVTVAAGATFPTWIQAVYL